MYQQIKLNDETDGRPSGRSSLRFSADGVYLITGGTGGLGLIFASYLVEKAKAKVILLGRSPLSKAKKKKMDAITVNADRIDYQQVDVSSREALIPVITKIKKNYGHIRGVIHSAGVLQDALLLNKQKEAIDTVLSAKVYGTIYLDEATQDEPLDFFALFSSLASVAGNAGQSDYAYANAFMDNFAQWRDQLHEQNKRKGKTISINWPFWADGGMQVNEATQSLMEETLGMRPLHANEGAAAWEQGLKSDLAQWIVVKGDERKIVSLFNHLSEHKKESPPTDSSHHSSSTNLRHESNSQKDLLPSVIEYLKKKIATALKLSSSQVDTKADFERYGIDSIMATQLTNNLEKDLGSLSRTLFFEYQTIEELAKYLTENHTEKLEALFGDSEASSSRKENTFNSSLQSASTEMQEQATKGQEAFFSLPKANLANMRFQQNQGKKNKPQEQADVLNEEAIAIIGLSGHYPGAKSLIEFWGNLKNGRSSIGTIPQERWDDSLFYDANKGQPGKIYNNRGSFITDIDKFDPLFFNISPREAIGMDPQERLFLQIAWSAFEDGGYTRQRWKSLQDEFNRGISVFVGSMYNHYHLTARDRLLNYTLASSSYWSIANRVSYTLNLKGPSIAIDSACSSSLTAIHMACESIKRKESIMAIAGGVNLHLHPAKYLSLSQAEILGSKEWSMSLGEGDGYLPSEGSAQSY